MIIPYTFNINGKTISLDIDSDTPLLWVIRDHLGLTGTKFACGAGYCGACTVLLNGKAVLSCVTPISLISDQHVTTIEGLAKKTLHPVQKAWITEQVTQCGYCQPGQIMAAVALLEQNAAPTDDDIDTAMSGNLCRCGTYQRIRRAIHTASKQMDSKKQTDAEPNKY